MYFSFNFILKICTDGDLRIIMSRSFQSLGLPGKMISGKE